MNQPNFAMSRQFVMFCMLGAVGTLAHYIVLVGGVELGIRPVVSSTLGFTVGALVNYTLSYYCLFHSESSHPETMAKFFTVAVIGLVINSLVLSWTMYNLGLHYLLGQGLATGLVVLWNFTCNRWWTFRKASYEKPE